jgi:hypothetical protein
VTRSRKQEWYDLGARAIANVTEGAVEVYVCPLCARPFPNIDDLTFEHAPPKSLGGREVALTCKRCNNTAGSSLDVEMRRAEDVDAFVVGEPTGPIRARFDVGAGAVNVDVQRGPDREITVGGLPDRNSPDTTAAHLAALDAMVGPAVPAQRLTFTFPRHRFERSTVAAGWLRAAYLLAFAKFGYRYALRSLFVPVRDQIADPTSAAIDSFYYFNLNAAPARRSMIAVAEPEPLRSLAVVNGRHLVYLPGFHADSDTLYERLRDPFSWPPGDQLVLVGRAYLWPTRPELLLDLYDAH